MTILLQKIIWEAEYRAHEWQQRFAQQQRIRSGQSGFSLTSACSPSTKVPLCLLHILLHQVDCSLVAESGNCCFVDSWHGYLQQTSDA